MASNNSLVKRSLIISFVGRYSIASLHFMSVLVLARLLTPAEIGIYTVGLAVVGIAHMFRDFGIGQYLVQERDLTNDKVAASLGLTISVAWPLGLVIYLSASHIAAYYEEKLVEQVIEVAAFNFFIIPLGSMAPALLKRSMSFGTLLKINLSVTVANVLVAISMAFMGYGVMSMAWATIAGAVVAAVLGQLYLPGKYRVTPSLRNAKAVIKFGAYFVGSNLANALGTSVPNLIVARVLGFSSLGLLSRAAGYLKIYQNLLGKATSPVIHAHFANISRRSGELLPPYMQAMNFMTLVGWTILSFMGLMAYQIVFILFGEQWIGAVAIASVLCVGALFSVVTAINEKALISMGKVHLIFKIAMLSNISIIVIIFIVAKYGLPAVALGLAGAVALRCALASFIATKILGTNLREMVRIFGKNIFIVFTSMLVPIYFFSLPVRDDITVFNALRDLVAAGTYSSIMFFVLIYITGHPLTGELTGVLSDIKKRLSRR